MSAIALTDASPRDVEAIASLHAQSWRNAYRGMLADDYLDRHVEADRLEFWRARFANVPADRRLVLQASVDGKLMGFVCVLLDADVQ